MGETTMTADTCPRCGQMALKSIAPISGVAYHVCPIGHTWSIGGQSPGPIDHPPHYCQGDIECIDAIAAALGDGFADYLRGAILKYAWRLPHKGASVEDAKKLAWYAARLVEVLGAGKK